MLIVDGARQIGKSYIIRYIGQEIFPNYIELNFEKDKLGEKLFQDVSTVSDFYLTLSSIAGDKMKEKENTLIFIDEIQAYPQFLTMIKFLMEEHRYTYIASDSLLCVDLKTHIFYTHRQHAYCSHVSIGFEEFLMANGVGNMLIEEMRHRFNANEPLSDAIHNKVMD